jgi:hypothetical protein
MSRSIINIALHYHDHNPAVPYRAQNAFTQSRSCLIYAFGLRLFHDPSTLRLLDGVGLGGLRICHIGVLLLGGGSIALLGLSLALLALDLSLLGGGLLLPLLALFRLLLLELVVVALDDGSGNRTDVLLLGDVLCLGSVLAVIVQPVLCVVRYCSFEECVICLPRSAQAWRSASTSRRRWQSRRTGR